MAKHQLIPQPLFDTLENNQLATTLPVTEYIRALSITNALTDYQMTKDFLNNYTGSVDTFNAYRREVERLLQWSWLIGKKSIPMLDRNDLRQFIDFVQSPPKAWLSKKNVARFIENENRERIPNPQWRPFVVRISKARHFHGEQPNINQYEISNKSMQALFATLSTYFTYLLQEDYVANNPIALIRQKSRYLQRQQERKVTRKLSHIQWHYVINAAEQLANQDIKFERILFIMSAFFLLGLRISELAETPGRIPLMGHFAPDKHGRWWFTTVGKGNKERDVAVCDEMLEALKRYRLSRDLTPLPARNEATSLLHREKGKGGLGTRHIRSLVQFCFNVAIAQLEHANNLDAAEDLRTATVHWLRHTSISMDVEERPREHVQVDAGHGSALTTAQYIDADREARHLSAKNKKLKPKVTTTA